MKTHFRQGDVLIIRVSRKPKGDYREKPRDAGRVVLAYGEVTGHAHAIADSGATLFNLFGAGEHADMWLKITTPVTLRHEEHAKIELPAGDYVVRRQREYHPKRVVYVAD